MGKMSQADLVKLAAERLKTAANGYALAVCKVVAKKNEPMKLQDLLAQAYAAGVRDCIRAQEVKATMHPEVKPGENPLGEVN